MKANKFLLSERYWNVKAVVNLQWGVDSFPFGSVSPHQEEAKENVKY